MLSQLVCALHLRLQTVSLCARRVPTGAQAGINANVFDVWQDGYLLRLIYNKASGELHKVVCYLSARSQNNTTRLGSNNSPSLGS